MAPRKKTAPIATYGDHEVIMPRKQAAQGGLRRPMMPGEEDPVARAEKALAELSSEFGAWMESECERLDNARRDVKAKTASPRRPAGRPLPRRP